MAVFDDVLEAARALNPTDKMRLAETLLDEATPADWPLPSEEWLAEAKRRSEDFDQGRTSAAPWAEVRARARRKAGLAELG